MCSVSEPVLIKTDVTLASSLAVAFSFKTLISLRLTEISLCCNELYISQ
jgi:hypothetical protein